MNFTFLIFNLKSVNMNFIFCWVFAVTIDNTRNNKTMVTSLEDLLSESGLTFTKQFHVPCMAHVLNLAV